MFKTKQITKLFVLINIIVIGFLLSSLITLNIKANSENDLIYNFDSDTLFNQNNDTFYGDFNTRDYEHYDNTGIYNGLYSFTEESDGTTGTDIDFVDYSSTEANTEIVSSFNEHTKILKQTNVGGNDFFKHNFDSSSTSGVIEFWVVSEDVTDYTIFRVYDESDIIYIVIQGDKWQYKDSGGWHDVGLGAIDNQWYHVKINFYTDSTMDLLIDNILYLNGIAMLHNIVDGIDFFHFYTYDVSSYIDAFSYYFGIDYTEFHFDVGTQDTYPEGICWDNSNFWIVGMENKNAYKYYANGTYTGFSFDISTQDIYPYDITWDGEFLWIIGYENNETYKYYINGTYTGFSFDTESEDTMMYGIISVNEFLWILGSDTDEVYKYYINGTYTGAHFYVGTQDIYPTGITWDGESFWITGNTNDKVFQYYINGTYTGINFDIANQDNFPKGIAWNNTHFFILGRDNDEVYCYKLIETGYNIGDNLEPNMLFVERGLEPDKWEFTHKGLFDHLENGDDNPTGWTDIEDGEDDVNCKVYGFKNNMLNGIVEFYASGDNIGLYKDNFGYSEDIALNVSFQFEIKYIYSVLNNGFYMSIFSSDDTQIVKIRIRDELTLDYWVSGTTYTTIDTGLAIDTYYDVNLFVDYDTDKCTLRYSADEVFIDSFEFPLTATAKTGLKKISFDVFADTDYCQIYLDSIGAYVNNRSITTDYAYVGLHVCDHTYWHFEEFNILELNIIGNGISIYLDNGYYVSQMFPSNQPEVISSAYDYTEKKIYNVYDFLYDDYWGRDYIWGGVLWFLFNNTFKFKETSIEGVKMVEGENEYPLEFAHSGVDVSSNYFYVDDNKLYFSQTSNDNNLEYIQATFNIDNIPSANRSISYKSIINGNSYGNLGVFYTDTSLTSLPLQVPVSAPNVILPQDKTIYSFIILITDNDKDNIQGTTTGYITNVKLIFLPDVSLSIIVLNLMLILIPLLILIIPTLLIYCRFGKNTIIPTFLLMTFICFITNLIPLWLFFVILLSCGAFIFIQKTVIKEV